MNTFTITLERITRSGPVRRVVGFVRAEDIKDTLLKIFHDKPGVLKHFEVIKINIYLDLVSEAPSVPEVKSPEDFTKILDNLVANWDQEFGR